MKLDLAKLLNIPKLPVHIEKVGKAMEAALRADDVIIREECLRLVKSGGKRLRPTFVIAAALSQGGRVNNDVIAACAAIELIHISSLVHDDIIDNAKTRRGLITVNAKEGNDTAIIVGDYLFALGMVQASTVNKRVAHVVASAFATICDGQSQETADNFNIDRTIESYFATINKKTAALLSAACEIGAICAGLPDHQVEALAKYGEAFGIAFQIADDLLDLTSTAEVMGKPVGNDVTEGVYTLPLLLALQSKSGDTIKDFLGKNPVKNLDNKELVDELYRIGAVEATLAKIKEYNQAATDSLQALDQTNIVKGLTKLPDAYFDWALKAIRPMTE